MTTIEKLTERQGCPVHGDECLGLGEDCQPLAAQLTAANARIAELEENLNESDMGAALARVEAETARADAANARADAAERSDLAWQAMWTTEASARAMLEFESAALRAELAAARAAHKASLSSTVDAMDGLQSQLSEARALLKQAARYVPGLVFERKVEAFLAANPESPRAAAELAEPYGTADESPGFNATKPLARRAVSK